MTRKHPPEDVTSAKMSKNSRVHGISWKHKETLGLLVLWWDILFCQAENYTLQYYTADVWKNYIIKQTKTRERDSTMLASARAGAPCRGGSLSDYGY